MLLYPTKKNKDDSGYIDFMRKILLLLTILISTGCHHKGETSMNEPKTNQSNMLCGDKPNCISTAENRDEFSAAPFVLKAPTDIKTIVAIAKKLKGAELVELNENYAHIECKSTFFRFVDDIELYLEGDNLTVRSKSRVGYSDFGVNKKRIEQLRKALLTQGII